MLCRPPTMTDAPTASPSAKRTKIAGMSAWLFYSLVTIFLWGAWGAVSKVASDGIDANTNQVYFTLGLLPLILIILRSQHLGGGNDRKMGIRWAFITGILGGTGNIAFFQALVIGGKASIVIPVTALFPLVTVILATTILHEKMGTSQKIGLVPALAAIYILSLPS
jgi:bacterial/archaeal transporter family protein